jgi:hypothetical protein
MTDSLPRPLRLLLVLLYCSTGVSWVRLLEPSFFLRPWSELLQAPLPELLGTLLAAPLFELLARFPAYVLTAAVHFGALTLRQQQPSAGGATLLGGGAAALVFVSLAWIDQTWVMRGAPYTSCLFVLYAGTGAVFGWLCHRFELDEPVAR